MKKSKVKTDAEVIKEITERVMDILQQYPYELSAKAIGLLFMTSKIMEKGQEKKTIQ